MKKIFAKLQYAIPQHTLSKAVGSIAASKNPLIKDTAIKLFAKTYDIRLQEYAIKDFKRFESFNDFFTRAIALDSRPLDSDKNSIICPADGSISQVGSILKDQILQAKGLDYSVGKLLGDPDYAARFNAGAFATIYLAPSDYHRVHMPVSATLTETTYIPGDLFSVNNATAAHVENLFARNERMVCRFEIENQGRRHDLAVVLVGAMIVAGIETVATGKMCHLKHIKNQKHNMQLNKGEELGRFYLGSTAIVLLPSSLSANWSTIKVGDKVKMGQKLGMLTA